MIISLKYYVNRLKVEDGQIEVELSFYWVCLAR